MQIKVKLLSFEEPASDGSRIGREVVEKWINSDSYRNAIASKSLWGTMSHSCRNVATGVKNHNAAISKGIGKNDLLILPDESAPTHYITKLECGNDGWLYAYANVFDIKNGDESFDDNAIQYIKRLRSILAAGCLVGCSSVVLGYWNSSNTAGDVLERLVSISGFDITLNPAWKAAQVVEIRDDDGNVINSLDKDLRNKEFSDIEANKELKYEGLKAKTFSDLSSFNIEGLTKTSKIDNKFTTLKAKEFSSNNTVEYFEDHIEEKEKEFSVVSVRERLREAKLSPRMYFRKTYISYRQVVRQLGSRLDKETSDILRSLFTSDVLYVIQKITPDVLAGKPLSTLLGAGALGKEVRLAAQKLQIPFRMAMTEAKKQGFVSKVRYQKLQGAYMEFINSLLNDVFTNTGEIPDEEELEKADKNNKNEE